MTVVIGLTKPIGQSTRTQSVNSGFLGMLAYLSSSGVPPNNNVSVKSKFKDIKTK